MSGIYPENSISPARPADATRMARLSAITPGTLIIMLAAAAVWAWSAMIVLSRQHIIFQYRVKELAQLDVSAYVICGLCACALLAAIVLAAGANLSALRRSAYWLAASGVIMLIDIARAADCQIMPAFWEALVLAFATGQAVWTAFKNNTIAVVSSGNSAGGRGGAISLLSVIGASAAMGVWWFFQGCEAYDNFMMSYSDFALVGQRIVNTWRGDGFLWHDSFRPAFFDHFDPALVVLVPLWGLWPDPRLFMAVQAVCLAAPAIFVYLIARRIGSSAPAGAAWSLGYLVLPAVGQLNLSLLYGWHPISLALPVIFACLYCLVRGRRISAAILALAACCVEETVMPVLVSMCIAFAIQAWLAGRKKCMTSGNGQISGMTIERKCGIWPGENLRPFMWLITGVIFAIAFILVTKLTPMGQFQTQGKFSHLGDGPVTILLSPILRPGTFWGEVLSEESFYFASCLLVPAGLIALLRGWPMLIAIIPPLAVVLAVNYSGAKSIGFWYGTLLLPIIVTAAMLGCVKRPKDPDVSRLMPAGAAAMLAAGLTASLAFGDLPVRQYQPVRVPAEKTAEWNKRNEILFSAIKLVANKDSSVLATSNIAAHLLGVKRLYVVRDVEIYDRYIRSEADARHKKWIELFDWVILDLQDRFQQDEPDMRQAAVSAEEVGFTLAFARNGVLVYQKPSSPADADTRPAAGKYDPAGLLAPWRATVPENFAGMSNLNDDLAISSLTCSPQSESAGGCIVIRGEFVLAARVDHPKEYWIEIVASLPDGQQLTVTGHLLPAGGNRPTSWWRKGEAFRTAFSLRLPAVANPGQISLKARDVPVRELLEGQPGRHDLP